MVSLKSLTEQLSAAARERFGFKPELSSPKIEALLRTMPEQAREDYCRAVLQADLTTQTFRTFAEALLVHETYFFRHPHQMRLLSEVLLPRLLRTRLSMTETELSVWCAGCSSGEEVYSVALLVQTALAAAQNVPGPGPGQRAQVLGTDLSRAALAQARSGDYTVVSGLNSFRDVPDFARHYFPGIFSATATTWSASPELRRLTRFQQHNLVADPPPQEGFDLILCRNTLIYFEEAAAQAAMRSLESALRPGGVLLLGPAESPREDSRLYMTDSGHAVFWTKPLGDRP